MCWGKLFLQGMPNMDDRSERYFGNYQLIRRLGQGSFADVYLAKHIHLDTQAAIKVLKLNLTSDNVEHFRTEARTVAQLLHPHIVRVLDFGIEGDTPYLVMDYASNGSLRQRYPRRTRLPLTTIVSYIKQVAEALQYAHEKRLIHRDIKPENMLLGEHYEILLSDFGIATITQSTHYQNIQEISGTVAYMAPEQLQGKPRRASDQYSLGIVVYEWLCGDRPFHGSFMEIYSQHLSVPPPSICEKAPEVPTAVEQVVLMALAKDPQQRFSSVENFALALERACQADQINLVPLAPSIQSASHIPSTMLREISPVSAMMPEVISPPVMEISEVDASPSPSLEVALFTHDNHEQDMNSGSSGIATIISEGGNLRIPIEYLSLRYVIPIVLGATLFGSLSYFFASFSHLIALHGESALYAFPAIPIGVLGVICLGIAIALFFGAVFGPWVGLSTGGIGFFIGNFISGSTLQWNHILGIALVGFVAGLAVVRTHGRYDNINAIAFVDFMSTLGIVIGFGFIEFSDIWLSNLPGEVAWINFISTSLPAVITALITLPILLIIYTALVRKIEPLVEGRKQ